MDAIGVNMLTARYVGDIPNGLRFDLINGDITPPRAYATVDMIAQDGGYEFVLKAHEGASEREQRSVEFISAGPASDAILMELTGRAVLSAPDPKQTADRMMGMDCGAPYPVELRARYEGTTDGDEIVLLSIWNVAIHPEKRIATIRVGSEQHKSIVEIAESANGIERTATYELRNRDVMQRLLSTVEDWRGRP